MLKVLLKFWLVVMVFVSIFLGLPVKSVSATTTCLRSTSGSDAGTIAITLNIAYYQTKLFGGARALLTQKPIMDLAIQNAWKGATTACGIPVSIKVNSKIATGIYKGLNNEATTKVNGVLCNSRNPGYYCIKVEDSPRIIGSIQEGGMIMSGYLSSPGYKSTIDYRYGWWNFAFEQDYLHESGHLLWLGEEYAEDLTTTARSLMGNASSLSTGEQRHIDQIVKMNCIDSNFVCEENVIPFYSPHSFCCNYQPSLPEVWEYWGGVETCAYDETVANTCPANTCIRARLGDKCDATTCKCSGTPPIEAAPPPSSTSEIISDPGGSPAGCIGILCPIICIRDGSCTPCDIYAFVMEIGKFILAIVGGVALFFVVYGGLIILASAGTGQRVSQGKGIIINALIGLVITFTAYTMVTLAIYLATGATSVFAGSLVCGV